MRGVLGGSGSAFSGCVIWASAFTGVFHRVRSHGLFRLEGRGLGLFDGTPALAMPEADQDVAARMNPAVELTGAIVVA